MAYVGSMYFKFTEKSWFFLIFSTSIVLRASPMSSSFTLPEPSFFAFLVILSLSLIRPSSAPSATTITA
jgi:hypothetical protein